MNLHIMTSSIAMKMRATKKYCGIRIKKARVSRCGGSETARKTLLNLGDFELFIR